MSMTERLTKRHPNGVVGISKCRYYNFDDFQKMAKKLADYEDIGTVSEFRELMEKATAKKPSEIDERAEESFYYLSFLCPTCGESVIGQPYRPNNCKHCGQKLDWSEGKE